MSAEPLDPHSAPAAGERPSKSQRKREVAALQSLGARLVALDAAQLARVPLPESLREAVAAAQRIRAHGARRRQLQYVSRLMRQVEPGPIECALDDLCGGSRAAVARMHGCERWRQRLLDDDGALTELLREHPTADAQALRALIRGARRERDGAQPPKHTRALYRWLRDALGAAGG